jgi:hypothetical protein
VHRALRFPICSANRDYALLRLEQGDTELALYGAAGHEQGHDSPPRKTALLGELEQGHAPLRMTALLWGVGIKPQLQHAYLRFSWSGNNNTDTLRAP